MQNQIKHSITLYGFGHQYLTESLSFEEILKKAGELGAEGIELVSPQMVPGHPNPSREWMDHFTGPAGNMGLPLSATASTLTAGSIKGVF